MDFLNAIYIERDSRGIGVVTRAPYLKHRVARLRASELYGQQSRAAREGWVRALSRS